MEIPEIAWPTGGEWFLSHIFFQGHAYLWPSMILVRWEHLYFEDSALD